MRIRGARGLGDAVYVYPIAKHFIDKGVKVEVMTRYPEIYNTLDCECIDRYIGPKPDIDCRYGPRYPNQETNMWEDTLIQAGLQNENIELKIAYDWSEVFKFPTQKKICLIKTPCYAQGKDNGMTACLLPKLEVFQKIIDEFKDQCYFVMAGLKNTLEFEFKGIDEDLSHIDKIPRLVALVDQSDIVLTPSSHFVSFAEGLDKKLMIGFAQTGIDSQVSFYRWSTPAKVITKPNTSDAFIDSEPITRIFERFKRLLDK